MVKKSWKNYLSFCLFILVIFFVVYYIKSNWSDFEEIKNISFKNGLTLFLAGFFYIAVQGLLLKEVVRPFKVELRATEWLGITFLTFLGNYFFPFGGFGFKAVYLKKKFNLDYSHFLGTLSAIYIINFFVFSLGGLIGLLALRNSGVIEKNLFVLFGFVFAFSTAALLSNPREIKTKNHLLVKIVNVINSWYQIRKEEALFHKLFLYTAIEFLLTSLFFYLAFGAFGLDVSFVRTFVISCLSDLGLFIRILPASFGLYEGAIIFTAKVLGFDLNQGVLVAAATRAVNMFLVFVLGPVFFLILTKKSKTESDNRRVV